MAKRKKIKALTRIGKGKSKASDQKDKKEDTYQDQLFVSKNFNLWICLCVG